MLLLQSGDVTQHRRDWRACLRTLLDTPPRDAAMSEQFHTQWHVVGHRVRELIDDDDLVIDMLWVWLPRYEGPSLSLYRGENIDRYKSGRVGSSWSDREEVAEMFASGLNSPGSGGTILRAMAPSDAIVAGPSWHSAEWLGEREFTVDTRRLGPIERLRDFPPAFSV